MEDKIPVVFDIETDGFNPTKIHCLSYYKNGKLKTTTDYEVMKEIVTDESHTLIGHDVIRFDLPVLERLLDVKINYQNVICTLSVSWYLYPERNIHGLESWGETFGIPKPEVEEDEWKILDEEEQKIMDYYENNLQRSPKKDK